MKKLLASLVAATLLLSVASVANPYFAGFSAFAEDDNSDPDKNSQDDRIGQGRDSESVDEESEGTVEDDEEREDDDADETDDEETEDDEQQSEAQLEIEEEGIEVEIEMQGIDLEGGMYDVSFSCTAPPTEMNIADAFKVEGGKGEFEAEIALTNNTYTGCKLTVEDTVIASFDSFTIIGEEDEEVKQKREERKRHLVNAEDATERHQRHLRAAPASPGEYEPGSSYTLTALGTAEDDDGSIEDATVSVDIAVWKSNGAVILFDVIGGAVELGGQTYTVELGYSLYSINSGLVRLSALATDESGDVLQLRLRGDAVTGSAEFPVDSGASLDLAFEGNSGTFKNELEDWELVLEGTVEAG